MGFPERKAAAAAPGAKQQTGGFEKKYPLKLLVAGFSFLVLPIYAYRMFANVSIKRQMLASETE